MEKSNEQVETKPCTIHGVSGIYICIECGTEQKYSEMKYAENEMDYSCYCKHCGELMESNGVSHCNYR